jgi:hypothetical protein
MYPIDDHEEGSWKRCSTTHFDHGNRSRFTRQQTDQLIERDTHAIIPLPDDAAGQLQFVLGDQQRKLFGATNETD